MAITAAQVKELRDQTWISMMECKKALVETDWDIEKAVDVLRKKWLAKAAKKADRETNEWVIKVEHDGNKCYVVTVSCETDFVARNDDFKAFMDTLVWILKKEWNEDSAREKMESARTEAVMKMWENLNIKDIKIIEWKQVSSYVHSNNKIAAIIVAKSAEDEKLRQVAMHVTATNPDFLSPDDISADVINKEKEIALEQMKNDPKMWNKPEQVLEKIIEWKMNKFKQENALLTQQFVVNPDQKVWEFIWKDEIVEFHRFSI